MEILAKCINNKGYPSSLTIGEKYQVIPDKFADETGTIRIIDDTGEAYYYSNSYFQRYATAN